MATKANSTPVLEVPKDEDKDLEIEAAKLEEMANKQRAAMQAEIERLKAENEQLKKNSVLAVGAFGAMTDRERVRKACEEASKNGVDAWTQKISVRAPRRPAKEEPYYWLSVNAKTIQVPADDRYYNLQLPFAQCLVDMIAAEWLAADYADKIENYDPVTNPKTE